MRQAGGILIAALLCLSSLAESQEQAPAGPQPDASVLREPSTLRLRVDKDHSYEEHYDKRIPYVAENDGYLFSGEQFGVKLDLKGDQVVAGPTSRTSRKPTCG